MNTDPVLAGFDQFLTAVRGIDARHIAQALNAFTPGTDWRGCSKYRMAERYGLAVADSSPGVFDLAAVGLRRLDLAALSMRAQACAEGCAGWSGLDAWKAAPPTPTTAEIAAEAFKAPLLAVMRQELHDVSRSLLRTEDQLRAAQQRVKDLQEHNAALLALVEQAAAPAAGASGRCAPSRQLATWPGSTRTRREPDLTSITWGRHVLHREIPGHRQPGDGQQPVQLGSGLRPEVRPLLL